MTISVEKNGCSSHQLILLTQGPICEILAKIAQLLGVVEKLSFFESSILNFFFQRNFFFAHSYLKLSQINGYQGWDEILMIILISSKKLGGYKIMRNTVVFHLSKGLNSRNLIFLASLLNIHCRNSWNLLFKCTLDILALPL
jgi:hypothetical protein